MDLAFVMPPISHDWWLAAAHRTAPARLGQQTRSIDKFIQLVAARQVVGLAGRLGRR